MSRESPDRQNKPVTENEIKNKILDLINNYLYTTRRQLKLNMSDFYVLYIA
jgi:hypothetical protein